MDAGGAAKKAARAIKPRRLLDEGAAVVRRKIAAVEI